MFAPELPIMQQHFSVIIEKTAAKTQQYQFSNDSGNIVRISSTGCHQRFSLKKENCYISSYMIGSIFYPFTLFIPCLFPFLKLDSTAVFQTDMPQAVCGRLTLPSSLLYGPQNHTSTPKELSQCPYPVKPPLVVQSPIEKLGE